ncbi:MAG: sensor histidine kinase, partial [Polyangiales bacterium]
SVLLREIHHRVKNNLQVISSLLYLQSTRVVDAGVRQLFQESRHRILSMAYIHETLYQSADLSRVDFPAYLRKLVGGLATSHASLAPNVEIVSDVENAELGLDAAVPCGLIVNELITNALKYAFPDGRRGSISVLFRKLPSGDHELRVCDDGVGLPDRIGQDAPTLGLELVRSLVEQLHATLTVDRAFGTCFCITFPPLPLRG